MTGAVSGTTVGGGAGSAAAGGSLMGAVSSGVVSSSPDWICALDRATSGRAKDRGSGTKMTAIKAVYRVGGNIVAAPKF